MVGVFVAFIRVVYGRMIYMSLPLRDNSQIWDFVNEKANRTLFR